MGISRFIVHFEHLPSVEEVQQRLLDLTGLPLRFVVKEGDLLKVVYPTRGKAGVELYWINDEQPPCLYVETSLSWNYVQVSAIHSLLQLGGKLEGRVALPQWAGKAWTQVKPDSVWRWIAAWLNQGLLR